MNKFERLINLFLLNFSDDEEAENFFGSGSNPVAVQRLLKGV